MNLSSLDFTPAALIVLCGLLGACVTDKELGDLGGGTDSGSGSSPGATTGSEGESTSTGATSGASATSTTSPTATATSLGSESASADAESSTGSVCEKTDCAQCPPPLVNVEYCVGGEFTCGCEFQRSCEVLEVACAYFELDPTFGEGAIHCGIATLADPVGLWDEVRNCVENAANNELAFKAVFELPSDDTPLFAGFVGLTGEKYQLKEFFGDTPGLGNRVDVRDCASLPPFACPLEVGEVCLECDALGEFTTFCQDNPE